MRLVLTDLMGLFLFVSAVKNKDPIELAAAIKLYLKPKNVISEVKKYSEWRTEAKTGKFDAHEFISQPIPITSIYLPHERWSVILYNNCPFDERDLSKVLSASLGTLVSLIEVYESDAWYHHLFLNGKIVDRFCSSPDQFEDRDTWESYQGNPKKLAFYFDVTEHLIEPYLRPLNTENLEEFFNKRAHVDDEFPLANEWVFVDFWKRLGIRYPSDPPELVIIHEEKE